MGKDATVNYSMYLCLVMATVRGNDSTQQTPGDAQLNDVLEPALLRLRQLLQDFVSQPANVSAAFDLERQIQAVLRELGRAGVEWALNHVEPEPSNLLPPHVEFEVGVYTRIKRKTPQSVATLFGKIDLWRYGYRPTQKTGDATIFPLAQQLGIIAGATPALAERAAYYQAEAGATQRRTLQRLKQEHGVSWGVKKLREVTTRISLAMAAERHAVQVEKLLQLLEQAWLGTGKHKPVLSVGRDGITVVLPIRKGTICEVASSGTVAVLDRRGKRLGTVYLAYMPESKQGTMSQQLTRLVDEVLRHWERPLPRLCYVTDAGDNETKYYESVLRRMKHPRTGERLEWVRVVDYYHASQRLWTMAEALFGSGSSAQGWVRRMKKLLVKPNGIRRVLNSAAVLRSRCELKGKAKKEFGKAYDYLRDRTRFMRYAAYKRVGVPCGSGITEAACKTIYTQRLKLSGMRFTKAGGQTILNLRVLLLSDVWSEAYRRVMKNINNVKVPTYDLPRVKVLAKAA
jgi:hypothetical protein